MAQTPDAASSLPPEILPADSKLQTLATGLGFTEGPVWTNQDGGYLLFSDIPNSKILKWTAKAGLTTFREKSNQANGNTRDREGRLLSCEHESRRVTLTEKDGSITILADSYNNKKLNSPNDIVVKSDGTLWFTDPPYGLPKGELKEQAHNFVFCYDPSVKTLAPVAEDFDMPNGLCFSPDETKLYIADSGAPHHIRVFDIEPAINSREALIPWRLTNGKIFCTIDKGVPDGIRCDEKGNVFSTAGDGIQIFSPEGKLLGKIPVPQSPANCCFGGQDNKTLFITARTTLYSIRLSTAGAIRN